MLLPLPGLVRADAPSQGPSVKHEPGKHIDFFVRDKLVGRYVYGEPHAKPHFLSLHSPSGAQLTRPIVPDEKDHPHQSAMWFTHGDVIPEGVALQFKVKNVEGVDFWAVGEGRGRQKVTGVAVGVSGSDCAIAQTKVEWVTADGQKLLEETRVIRLHEREGAWLLIFDIDLKAVAGAITFGDTKEGSFGVRVHPDIREAAKKGGTLENAEGNRGEKAIWGFPSAWCDYSGPVDGKIVGVAIFDHPQNAYPARWHSRGYGLMAANPFGRNRSGFPDAKGRTDLVKLAKGESLKLRYGLLLHEGNAKDGKVADHYAAYVKLERP